MASLKDITDSIGNIFSSKHTFDYRSPERQAQEGPLVEPTPQQQGLQLPDFQMPNIQLPDFGEMFSGFFQPKTYTQMWGVPTNQVIRISGDVAAQESPSPISSNNPLMQPSGDFYFDYPSIPRDQEYAMNGPRPNFQPQQPPPQISDIIRRNFPNEATQAAVVAASENATFDSNRPDNVNVDGTVDRGIFQINQNTFNGLMQRQGDRLREMGITSFEDMRDPEKNAVVAKMIKEGAASWTPETNPNGWGGWFGWQDTGYDLNKGYYSENRRIKHATKKKGNK